MTSVRFSFSLFLCWQCVADVVFATQSIVNHSVPLTVRKDGRSRRDLTHWFGEKLEVSTFGCVGGPGGEQ